MKRRRKRFVNGMNKKKCSLQIQNKRENRNFLVGFMQIKNDLFLASFADYYMLSFRQRSNNNNRKNEFFFWLLSIVIVQYDID